MYKGVLRSNGATVAVKVQRPGIGDGIAIDMLLLRRLMAVVDRNQKLVRCSPELAAKWSLMRLSHVLLARLGQQRLSEKDGSAWA